MPASRGDGQSFAYLAEGPESEKAYGPVLAEFSVGTEGAKYMIRDGRFKYTYWVHCGDELYDLRDDPEDLQNLARKAEYRETVERLKHQLFTWHRPAEHGQTCTGTPV